MSVCLEDSTAYQIDFTVYGVPSLQYYFAA